VRDLLSGLGFCIVDGEFEMIKRDFFLSAFFRLSITVRGRGVVSPLGCNSAYYY